MTHEYGALVAEVLEEKPDPVCISVHHKSTWTGLGSNLGPQCEMPLPNCAITQPQQRT